MTLVVLSGKIIHQGDHTIVVLQDDRTRHIVCIHGSPSHTIDLTPHIKEIERLAALKIEKGERAFDGRIWITADDVLGEECPSH